MTDMADTTTVEPTTEPDATVYVVGETDDKREVLSHTGSMPDETTKVWLTGETADQARPLVDLETEAGRIVFDPQPLPQGSTDASSTLLEALGWDEASTARKAESLHRVDPATFPTVESATYADPTPKAAPTEP